ncbi:DUF4369 domain-containing protein [Carboxylicivirga linearis]|uniref:DUF4369 domain-containing protein n=1 Tax=Carboxylicivirga linearis TaxID=1628157 RepID=A0ABS5JTT4_9BACT|nr:DUF4369 domain-containing protein [Carboxylicivirga linearis]MBS2098297.1 DUF4369 domain-containing protein [Carboxylicivirga linearis]
MNWRWILILLVAPLTFCSTNKTNYVIKGSLHSEAYNGEFIYLVPFNNPTVERVDSVMVYDGTFTFKGKVDQPEVYIVRTRPKLRLQLQELLIVKEPGDITIKFGPDSSASGTNSNDSLQKWKEFKTGIDNSHKQFLKQYKSDFISKETLTNKLDSLHKTALDYNHSFIKENSNNVAGQFVQSLAGMKS